MHIQDPVEKRWMQEQLEGADRSIEPDEQRHILGRLNAAEALETFLGTKYVGQKRFGIEGAESTIPLVDALLGAAADAGMAEAVIGMAHRGRLNVLVNIVGKDYGSLFNEFEGGDVGSMTMGSGDVKYHLGQTGTFVSRNGNELPLELAANPSHLEAVNPVVLGMVRARMDEIRRDSTEFEAYPVLPLLLHGDAAFAGQGVVAETLNLSQIRGYRVGGCVHVVINNQVGFTTSPAAARSSEYSTDVAKMIQAPIFHVNGDDPKPVSGRPTGVRVPPEVQQGRRDRHDLLPTSRPQRRRRPQLHAPRDVPPDRRTTSVRELYTTSLVKRGAFTPMMKRRHSTTSAPTAVGARRDAEVRTREGRSAADREQRRPAASAHIDQPGMVDEVYEILTTTPEGFTMHPKLAQQFATRHKMFEGGEIDWALGEAMAYGSLLVEGTSVRLSGQDSRRGTFSHRHATLVDYETSAEHTPLKELGEGHGSNFWVYDSLLSEYAVLGFEYGYSIATRRHSCSGKPSSATSPTEPRSSSTSSSSPQRTSGTRTAAWSCCSPRLRGTGP